MKYSHVASAITLAAITAGCSSSDSGSGTGSVSLNITDAPVDDAYSVVIQFNKVSMRGTGETDSIEFELDPAKSIDMLTLQGVQVEPLISDETVPAGTYDEIRLFIDSEEGVEDSYIVLEQGGQQYDLTVPSGSQSGYKVKGDLTVPVNGDAKFTIDFDVRHSIVKAGNENASNGVKYMLKPVAHLVQDDQTGVIAGTVAADILGQASGCSDDDVDTYNAVYVYEGNVIPDDIDGNDVEPLTSAIVAYNSESTFYEYEVGFLVAGEYTVAFTCNADAENIEADDELNFSSGKPAIVVAGEVEPVSFTADDI